MRLPLITLMAGAGLLACSGGGDSDAPIDAQSANTNNTPIAAAVAQQETAESFRGSDLNPPPSSAKDPGPRPGVGSAGAPLPNLTPPQMAVFVAGKEDFLSAEDVADGLGPTMNLDSCGGCHAQPATGGTSPTVNPQVAFANKDGM